MYEIGFVILHFKALLTTINSIESIIKNVDTKNYVIIVVDNGSPDDSGEKLEDRYKGNKNIVIIKIKKNMGFSGGNNVGFQYAKHKLECSYIVLMNNDIYLMSNNFFRLAKEDFERFGYYVLGPRIYGNSSKGKLGLINPISNNVYSIKRLRLEKFDCCMYLILSKVRLEEIWIFLRFKLYRTIKRLLKKNVLSRNLDYFDNKQFDVALQGCIWVFSPKYIELFEGLIEITFMYHEEEILWNQMKKAKGLMLYEPQIKVFHDHDSSSTRNVAKTLRENTIEKYRKVLKSTDDLIRYYKEVIR